MNVRKNVGWLCAMLLGVLSSAAHAVPVPAINAGILSPAPADDGSGLSSQPTRLDGPYTIGTKFTVGTTPLSVTQLGVQDVTLGNFNDRAGNGWGATPYLGNTIPVGIWDSTGATLLAVTGVLSTDSISGGYRYSNTLLDGSQSPIASLTLNANTSYIVGAQVGSWEPFGNDASNSAYTPVNPSMLTFVSAGFQSGFNGNLNLTGFSNNWGAGNFLFTPVPEPSSLAMLFVGGLFMGLFRRSRNR